MKKFLALLLALTMTTSVLVGCGNNAPAEENTNAEAVETAEETTEEVVVETEPVVFNWNIGSAGPKTIDPGLCGASDGGDVINQTFEGLVREKSGTVYPGLAESWETSEDGLTVTFHLRDGLKWSDGSDLTADDMVYSWLRGMAPETASEYSWIWEYTNVLNAANYVNSAANQAIIDAGVGAPVDPEDESAGTYTQEDVDAATAALVSAEDVGISAPDAQTFVVQLSAPTDYFVSLTAFYHFKPVKQSAVEAAGGEEGTWASNPDLVVSNGPFVLTEYTLGEGLVLTKNENYWNVDEVGIDVINGFFIDESATAYQAYQSGELDFLPDVPAAEIPGLIAEDPNFYVFPLLGTYYYSFNMDLDIWADAKVRQAISLAIDRQAICDTLAAGQVPAAGIVPPGFIDNNGDDFFETAGTYGLSTEAQVEEAKALLAEAGYPDGEGFPEFTLLYNTSENHQLVAEMIQENLSVNLGIECTLANQEWAVFQDTRKEGNFELARGGWLTDFMDPSGLLAIFQDGNAYNDPRYYNEEFETYMAAAAEAADPAVHYENLYKAQEVFMTDMPIIPVYHYSDFMLAADYVVGWDRSVLGTVDFSSATIEK